MLPKLTNADWVEEIPTITLISGQEYEVHIPEIRNTHDGSNSLVSKAEVIKGKFYFYHKTMVDGFYKFEKSKDGEVKNFPRLASYPEDEILIYTEDGVTHGVSFHWIKDI